MDLSKRVSDNSSASDSSDVLCCALSKCSHYKNRIDERSAPQHHQDEHKQQNNNKRQTTAAAVDGMLLHKFNTLQHRGLFMRHIHRREQKRQRAKHKAREVFEERKDVFGNMLTKHALLSLLSRIVLIPMECRSLPHRPWLTLQKRVPEAGFFRDVKEYQTAHKQVVSSARALEELRQKISKLQQAIDMNGSGR